MIETLPWIPDAGVLQEYLVKEGLAWVDDQAATDREYWFPSLCSSLHS